jgi:hypothetical protein
VRYAPLPGQGDMLRAISYPDWSQGDLLRQRLGEFPWLYSDALRTWGENARAKQLTEWRVQDKMNARQRAQSARKYLPPHDARMNPRASTGHSLAWLAWRTAQAKPPTTPGYGPLKREVPW